MKIIDDHDWSDSAVLFVDYDPDDNELELGSMNYQFRFSKSDVIMMARTVNLTPEDLKNG